LCDIAPNELSLRWSQFSLRKRNVTTFRRKKHVFGTRKEADRLMTPAMKQENLPGDPRRVGVYISGMQLGPSDPERDALVRFFRPRSILIAIRYLPRLAPLRAILAKLDPKPQAQSLPPPRTGTPRKLHLVELPTDTKSRYKPGGC